MGSGLENAPWASERVPASADVKTADHVATQTTLMVKSKAGKSKKSEPAHEDVAQKALDSKQAMAQLGFASAHPSFKQKQKRNKIA